MKKFNFVFIIAYFVLLAIPALTMPFFFNAKNTEKRELANFPKLVKEESINKDFVDELDDFVNDRIGLRQVLVSANTALKTGIFKHSTEDSIIVGKNDWLFYSDTASDYMGVRTLSDRNISNIVSTYEMVSDKLEEDGIVFVMTLIPNKNTVYPQYMPDTFVKTGNNSNMEVLSYKLKESGITYADVYSRLSSSDEILYQARDSHWTYKGAFYGYDEIMKSFGLENAFTDLLFEEKNDWDADLGVMLYSVNAKKDKQIYPEFEFTYEYTSHEKEPDSIQLVTENESASGKALIFRDSFMNTGHKYFAQSFEYCLFSRAYPYKIDLAYSKEADYVLLEIVERNIKNLAVKAPVMEAPKATIDVKDLTMADKNDYYLTFIEENGYTHIYGYIDEKYLNVDNDIYINVDGVIYKAFPIYEQNLLESEEIKDNGFSLYIPKTDANDFVTEVYIN